MEEIKVNLLDLLDRLYFMQKFQILLSVFKRLCWKYNWKPKKSEELDHGDNLVGHVTQEFRIEEEIARKSGWVDFLSKCINFWITNDMKKNISKLDINSSWIDDSSKMNIIQLIGIQDTYLVLDF